MNKSSLPLTPARAPVAVARRSTGPVAVLLSARADPSNDNPIGPLDPSSSESKSLDSLGSAAARATS